MSPSQEIRVGVTGGNAVTGEAGRSTLAPAGLSNELCERLLCSLTRRDQQNRGKAYISGLLSAPGRKTIRNIASLAEHDREATRQRLSHFISHSTWEWQLVRQALTQYLNESILPKAWVIEPMVTPKSGDHSVGVDKSFASTLGTSVNSQQAFGLWLTTTELSCPVNWRLLLSGRWLDESSRRRRALIPDWVKPLTREQLVFDLLDEMTGVWGSPSQPIIMDASECNVGYLVEECTIRELPFIIQIHESTPVVTIDPPPAGLGGGTRVAQQVAESIKGLRRPIAWINPVDSVASSTLTSLTRVTLPPTPVSSGGHPLTLLSEWARPVQGPSNMWLTNMIEMPPASLLRFTRFKQRVTTDLSEVGVDVGIQDFEGRSFGGWHRHTTLTSVAHTMAIQSLAG